MANTWDDLANRNQAVSFIDANLRGAGFLSGQPVDGGRADAAFFLAADAGCGFCEEINLPTTQGDAKDLRGREVNLMVNKFCSRVYIPPYRCEEEGCEAKLCSATQTWERGCRESAG